MKSYYERPNAADNFQCFSWFKELRRVKQHPTRVGYFAFLLLALPNFAQHTMSSRTGGVRQTRTPDCGRNGESCPPVPGATERLTPLPTPPTVSPDIMVVTVTGIRPASSTLITSTSIFSLPPQQTLQGTETTTTSSGLSRGAKAGIGIGVVIGVVLVAIAAFLLGFRARHKPNSAPSRSVEPDCRALGYKAELDGSGRQAAELDGRGIARWWSTRFRGSMRVRALNDPRRPEELPAEG
ncbi:hypothetical protein CC86DRAFT_380363 [Ophiobolus disseminans]|uniref:Mid2 domain-containing protein n=1 Tax=Ophiobolus disseminans TaxID=1469910 RepID=A0A6A7A5I2_9PLEO|nr:hypothetical protein CC86DRAFT_380363 [Ophiobolus disseminans]